jgi:biotin synthase
LPYKPRCQEKNVSKFQAFAESALAGDVLTREQCLAVLRCPDTDVLSLLDAAYRVRHAYFGNRAHIQLLSNAKSGNCPEDCHYCSQSRVAKTPIETYPLLSTEELLEEARRAKSLNVKRFCMALSGSKPSEKDLASLCETVRAIKKETGLALCGSLGFLDLDQAERLKEAGLDRVNHNLNTSEGYHAEICSTHSFQDRVDTIQRCQSVGLEICAGGIVGQGESDDDIIDLLLRLRELQPEAIPINFLIPVEGTPFADKSLDLNPRRCLKILSLARFLCPDREIRAAGGREYHLRSLQPMALYVIDSIFVAGYLTTGGQPAEEALQMLDDLGFELVVEGNTGVAARNVLARLMEPAQ